MPGDSSSTPTSTKITVAEVLIDLKYIRSRIDQVCDDSKTQDSRIDKIERVIWLLSGTTAMAIVILAPVAASAIKVWLGLP